MSHLIDVLIPTWNNPQYLFPCVKSLLDNTITPNSIKIHVINNGTPESVRGLPDYVNIFQMDSNKNWAGGLKAGLEATSAPYVLFCNDDIIVPDSSSLWANVMLQHFLHDEFCAVGPSSNFVMGDQAIWKTDGATQFIVPYLIGFFLLIRRSDLMAAGGIDPTFTCGDDLDLSIRLRKLGKHLVANKELFIYHHGAKTGPRVEGNYWYSGDQQMETWNHLFKKHGVSTVFNMLMQPVNHALNEKTYFTGEDAEGNHVRSFLNGNKVLELGCGATKTVPHSYGLDIVPKGQPVGGFRGDVISVADQVCDVTKPLPVTEKYDCVIARHILEHTIDPLSSLRNWVGVLKHGGRLILAVPDQTMCNSIPLNPEHLHAFTADSLRNLAGVLGLKEVEIKPSGNNVSLVGCFERNGSS